MKSRNDLYVELIVWTAIALAIVFTVAFCRNYSDRLQREPLPQWHTH